MESSTGIDARLDERIREAEEQGDEGADFVGNERPLVWLLGFIIPIAMLLGGWLLYAI